MNKLEINIKIDSGIYGVSRDVFMQIYQRLLRDLSTGIINNILDQIDDHWKLKRNHERL